MKNHNLQTIIEDYFSITGRPIATLTVDEYVKFLEIAGNSVSSSTINSSLQEFSLPVDDVEKQVSQEPEVPIITIRKPETSTPKPQKEKPKPSKEEMLKILRSVSS